MNALLSQIKLELSFLQDLSRKTRRKENKSLDHSRDIRDTLKNKEILSVKENPENSLDRVRNWTLNNLDEAKEEMDRHLYEFFGLHRYRTHKVRKAARFNHLLYGFLRDVPYSVIESEGAYEPVPYENLLEAALELSFEGENVVKDKFSAWMEAAQKYSDEKKDTKVI